MPGRLLPGVGRPAAERRDAATSASSATGSASGGAPPAAVGRAASSTARAHASTMACTRMHSIVVEVSVRSMSTI